MVRQRSADRLPARASSPTACSLGDRLAALLATSPPRSAKRSTCRGAAKDPRLTAEFLLKVPGIVVVVDGYNVAKLAWPDLRWSGSGSACSTASTAWPGASARSSSSSSTAPTSSEHTPIGVASPGSATRAGVTADDVIREEIARLDLGRSAAVVTNDREVRRDAAAAGANIITSDALVDVALG